MDDERLSAMHKQEVPVCVAAPAQLQIQYRHRGVHLMTLPVVLCRGSGGDEGPLNLRRRSWVKLDVAFLFIPILYILVQLDCTLSSGQLQH